MAECSVCSRSYTDAEGPRCPNCDGFIGYPNVRQAEREENRTALEERYRQALEDAGSRGVDAHLAAFEAEIDASRAVVNVDLRFLHLFVTSDLLYTTYREQVRSGARAPAAGHWDRQRAGVDAILFGTYDEHMRFAALALDGAGLSSYGPYSLTLDEAQIAPRASLLDENAFDFVRRHGLGPLDDIPPGHIATWAERARLAVAKLGPEVDADTPFATLLLSSNGDRTSDRFLEVHIFGPFGKHAVRAVRAPSAKPSKPERALLGAVRDHLDALGAVWNEP